MQERPSASTSLIACGVVSGYSAPFSMVSKRRPVPSISGSCGRLSGVISVNLWVSFIAHPFSTGVGGLASQRERAFHPDRKGQIRTFPKACPPVRACQEFHRGARLPESPRPQGKDRDRTGFYPVRASPPPHRLGEGIHPCRWTVCDRCPALPTVAFRYRDALKAEAIVEALRDVEIVARKDSGHD